MSTNYGKTIKVKRTYYESDPNGLGASQKVGHAVADGILHQRLQRQRTDHADRGACRQD